jgi:uncharacterized RDD family membrane protein YckC
LARLEGGFISQVTLGAVGALRRYAPSPVNPTIHSQKEETMNENIQQYAGFWRRFAAYLIDSMVIAFALVNYRSLMYNQLLPSVAPRQTIDQIITLNQILAVAVGIIGFLFAWVYFSGMESSPFQATIGKVAVGIYVADLQGQRISFGRATGRFFGKILSGAILLIGYLMAGFTEKKQALHDTMAGCLVLVK